MTTCSRLHVSPKRARPRAKSAQSISNGARVQHATRTRARTGSTRARAKRAFCIAPARGAQLATGAPQHAPRAQNVHRAAATARTQHVTRARAPAARTRNARVLIAPPRGGQRTRARIFHRAGAAFHRAARARARARGQRQRAPATRAFHRAGAAFHRAARARGRARGQRQRAAATRVFIARRAGLIARRVRPHARARFQQNARTRENHNRKRTQRTTKAVSDALNKTMVN